MSYHLVRPSRTGHRSVVSPSKFQLVLQIRKSLSSVAAPKRSIAEQVPTRVTDKEVAQLSCSARMSYHLVRPSRTGHRSVVSPSKFQLVLQIRKSLSSVAAPVCPITWYVQVRLAIERSIAEQVPTRVTDKEVAQLSCSARMSYHLVRQVRLASVVSPSKFQLVLQIRKSLSSVAAPVCPITWYVQVRLAIEA
ncbi:hypothetical protein J6590_018989 [Homalodisca vitripennis]|nr:hypothetical protein J6590_018989 [Homalodisca vitripennis]